MENKKGITDDPKDTRLGRGIDKNKIPQHEVYLVLSEEERGKGFIRPVRRTYVHELCGVETTMGLALAETYARDPKFYGATYCCGCSKHLSVDEFMWDGTKEKVGS